MPRRVLISPWECEQIALEQSEIDNSDGAELSSFKGESIYANSNGLIAKLRNTKTHTFLFIDC